MTFGDLVRASRALTVPGLADSGGLADRRVASIAYDSRDVVPGAIFVALKGEHADGARFAADAARRGAIAVIAEGPAPADPPAGPVWLSVSNARAALAELAAVFFGRPSEQLTLVGVTGTNGKTTTTYLLAAIFDAAGIGCGRIGTVSTRIGDEERDAARTTPEAPDLQRLLREMVDRGLGACAMEVSSHALALHRVDDVRFAAGVFSNLTRDHLDFHGDMERYFAAKRRLFELLPDGAPAIINVDDPRGADLAAAVGRPLTYALDKSADVKAGQVSYSLDGLAFDLTTPRGTLHLRSPLVGRPNAYNIVAAAATAVALDLPFDAIERGLAGLEAVPGRFEMASSPSDDVRVVVDYAHTDDALKNLLETARPLAKGRVITVFGCGGDRDATKRPLMGAVAARLSDLVIVTSDNPRSENPERIIEEIRRGMAREPGAVIEIVDRRQAIDRAIKEAKPGDLVLIAGKGHEKYQVIGERTLPFDDVQMAGDALARRRSGSRV
ncbi:MAG TPA: UDP-N-acetylmuramoyl-L-alanyl-D-glutamate--2,6-diaminopimelate ligase [Vicinamibacterales bacterium]|nr:UDP-N-acetylmuramoyl-L-alanyl-D-glutamate--2,6-diaminopimelate ligase [Vicinamibacterales bacterium]